MLKEFNYYIQQNLVKKESPNRMLANSLLNSAIDRTTYVKRQTIDNQSATYVFEDIYEAIREAAQALMELKGYKPYSHEALVSFLLEYFKLPKQHILEFNRYRILRNKVVYKAQKITVETCEESLKFLDVFLPELKAEFEKIR